MLRAGSPAGVSALLPCVQGTRREVLRGLCQVVNSTELALEVCLVDVEDSDWQMVAARSGRAAGR